METAASGRLIQTFAGRVQKFPIRRYEQGVVADGLNRHRPWHIVCSRDATLEACGFTVLRRMSKSVRLRAASVLVALYSFCLLVPPTALALGDSSRAAYGLTQETRGSVSTHVHADGTVHAHANPADQQDLDGSPDQQSPAPNCCGLACVTAIGPDIQLNLIEPMRFTTISSLIAEGVPGRTPDRLDRPPISPLSL